MKILTWNMQGQDGIGDKISPLEGLLNAGTYDVVCLQEATRPLNGFECIEKRNNVSVWQHRSPINPPRGVNHIYDYTAFYYSWGNGNLRCSLVTYVKNVTPKDSYCVCPDPESANTRPMLCVSHNGLCIGNVHLISGNPQAAYLQFTRFKDVIPAGMPYCIIGDFNIDARTNPNIQNDGCFHYVKMATQINGGCLDYMYSQLQPKFERLAEPGRYSDHSPVEYDL